MGPWIPGSSLQRLERMLTPGPSVVHGAVHPQARRDRADCSSCHPKRSRTRVLRRRCGDAATALRSSMDAAEYKHVVLGLIFLKYVSDTFMVRHEQLRRLVDDEDSEHFMPTEEAKQSIFEDRDEYTAEGVFWIPRSEERRV